MTERQFAPGDTIYREGERSDFAYFIKSGRVEILKTDASGPHQVTVLGEGEVFGEMGVILDQRRSVTARALDAVVLRAISRAGFLQAVNQQPEAARPMLKTLLTRLHREESHHEERRAPRLHAVPPPEPGESAVAQFSKLRLMPASEALAKAMPPYGLELSHLPFRVGRKTTKGEGTPSEKSDLALDDAKPFNLSRLHFAIEQSQRGLVVRDCGSHLGTSVNGVRIGNAVGIHIAIVRTGENEIVAGGTDSPYRFTLQVAGD